MRRTTRCRSFDIVHPPAGCREYASSLQLRHAFSHLARRAQRRQYDAHHCCDAMGLQVRTVNHVAGAGAHKAVGGQPLTTPMSDACGSNKAKRRACFLSVQGVVDVKAPSSVHCRC